MKPQTAVWTLLGGAVALAVLERFTKATSPGTAERLHVPDDPPPTPAISQPPHQLPPGAVSVVPGARYLATVNVSFPLSILASASKVATQAQGQGFTNVAVTTSKPVGWPGASGDYYVTATYAGPPKFLDRSAAGGQVTVTDAWQG